MDHQRTAVMAHGLLGSVSFVMEAAHRLADDWDEADAGQQLLLQKLHEHANHIGDVLHALVRGLPVDA